MWVGHYSLSHIINNIWYTHKEVIKSELEVIVAKYGDCISKLSKENVIPSEKKFYDMSDNDILNDELANQIIERNRKSSANYKEIKELIKETRLK